MVRSLLHVVYSLVSNFQINRTITHDARWLARYMKFVFFTTFDLYVPGASPTMMMCRWNFLQSWYYTNTDMEKRTFHSESRVTASNIVISKVCIRFCEYTLSRWRCCTHVCNIPDGTSSRTVHFRNGIKLTACSDVNWWRYVTCQVHLSCLPYLDEYTLSRLRVWRLNS